MAKTKNPPCIRNLDRFKKTGCPQCLWDGENGCPAWVEMSWPDPDNPNKRVIEKACVDMWIFRFQHAQLGLLEGNQQAVESFRNGMTFLGDDGKAHPKPDPALARLLQMAERQQLISGGRKD